MKRLLFLLILFFGITSFAQQKTAIVTLKNGTTLTGTIIELNPASHVTLSISGYEAKINMADIESISDIPQNESSTPIPIVSNTNNEEDNNLPLTYIIKVGPYEIEMALVKGSTFSMGYDGRGSRAMNSEPIHDVTLSSFYVNTRPLSKEIVAFIKRGKQDREKEKSVFHPARWNEVKSIVDRIAEQCDLPINMITEAQWEYVATHEGELFSNSKELVFCLDYYGDFMRSHQIDPTGPKDGRKYVVRQMADGAEVYTRMDSNQPGPLSLTSAIRFTFPASSLK